MLITGTYIYKDIIEAVCYKLVTGGNEFLGQKVTGHEFISIENPLMNMLPYYCTLPWTILLVKMSPTSTYNQRLQQFTCRENNINCS